MIKGQRKEYSGYTLKVGFFHGKVIAINPTLEQIADFQSIDNMKEPDYNADYVDKNSGETYKQASIVFYIQAHDGSIHSKRFQVIDKVRENKDNTKVQFINNIGTTTWATDEEALKAEKFAWFTKRPYRKALTGEEKLYNFLQKWTSLDWKDPETELSLDMDKMINGKFKQIQDLLAEPSFRDSEVCGNATIHTVIPAPTDENPTPEPKVYQSIWDKFLPGNSWKFLTNDVRVKPKFIQEYIADMKGEYGTKDYSIYEELRDYDPAENPIANPSTMHSSETANVASSNQGITKDDLPF